MKNYIYIIAIFFVTTTYAQTDRWLQGRLVTERNNINSPIENTVVSIVETGDKDKTDENGKYRIKLKESFSPGENISLSVEKKDWAILYPLNGKTFIPKNSNKELVDILILPIESKKFFSHDHLEKLILNLMTNRTNANDINELPKKINLPDNIKEWAKYYHYTIQDVKHKIDEWTKELEKNREDPYKLGLAALVKGNYDQAGNHFNNSAIYKFEEVKKVKNQLIELNEKQVKLSEEIIRDFQKAGDSFSESQNYNQAVIAFENALKYVDKNKSSQLWIDLMMDRAFSFAQLSRKTTGSELFRNINSAIETYNSILDSHNEKLIDSALVLLNKGVSIFHKANCQKANKAIENIKIGLNTLKESLKIYQKENNNYRMGALKTNILAGLGYLALNSTLDSTFYFFYEGLKFGKEALKGFDKAGWEIAVPMINISYFNLFTRSLTDDNPLRRMLSTTLLNNRKLNDLQMNWVPILKRIESLIYFDSVRTNLIANKISSDIETLNELILILTKEDKPIELSYARNNYAFALLQKSFSLNKHNSANTLQEVLDTLQNNFTNITKEEFPQDWTITKIKVGLIKIISFQNNKKSKKLLNDAITIFNEVLEIYDEKYSPSGFAETNMYLGIAFKELALLEDDINKMYYLSSALKALNESLTVYAPKFNPLKWLETQYNISDIFNLLGNEDEAERILEETEEALFP